MFLRQRVFVWLTLWEGADFWYKQAEAASFESSTVLFNTLMQAAARNLGLGRILWRSGYVSARLINYNYFT